MHIRVAGLINLIGVVARLIKEKEETVVDLELLCHIAPLSLYLPLSLPLSQDVRGSGLLKRREANLSRAGTFFFFLFFSLIDRMIILSFEQINEHSRAQRRRFIRPRGEAVVGMIRTKRKIIRVSPTSHSYGAISAGQDFSSSTTPRFSNSVQRDSCNLSVFLSG